MGHQKLKGMEIHMKKKTGIFLIAAISAVTLSACAQTDVVGAVAKTSFAKVVTASGEAVTADDMNGGWSLTAPDNTARFIWVKDFSASSTHDVMLEFDAAPFIAAGLDTSKLPDGILNGDKLMVGTDLGDTVIKDSESATPSSSFNEIVDNYRASVGYHEALDHYGVDLGGGNKFEWAKDMSTNDKDIVFVVDPEILISAGVNPENVEGWKYASVTVKDSTGKSTDVMKFLKPFNLQ